MHLNSKIVHNHSSAFKLPGVRGLLNRMAALSSIDRIHIGKIARTAHVTAQTLVDPGVTTTVGGKKYIIRTRAVAIDIFIVPTSGQADACAEALVALPNYERRGQP